MAMTQTFDALARPHISGLRCFAVRLTRDAAEADDLLQEALEAGLRRLATLREPEAFQGWMRRIMRNVHIDRRLKQRSRSARDALVGPRLVSAARDPDARLSDRRLSADLVLAIEGLPSPQRAAVQLVDVEGLTFREAAAALDVAPGTVASRVARGRCALRACLAHHARDRGLR
jgi:RNA polymerase sigma-70 factor (ECF subfamily)